MEEQFIGERQMLSQQMGRTSAQREKPKKSYLFYFVVIMLILFVVYMTMKEGNTSEKFVDKINVSQVKVIIEIKKIGNETNLSKYNITDIYVNRLNITKNMTPK